jgi:hypothetical protein
MPVTHPRPCHAPTAPAAALSVDVAGIDDSPILFLRPMVQGPDPAALIDSCLPRLPPQHGSHLTAVRLRFVVAACWLAHRCPCEDNGTVGGRTLHRHHPAAAYEGTGRACARFFLLRYAHPRPAIIAPAATQPSSSLPVSISDGKIGGSGDSTPRPIRRLGWRLFGFVGSFCGGLCCAVGRGGSQASCRGRSRYCDVNLKASDGTIVVPTKRHVSPTTCGLRTTKGIYKG